MTTFIKGDPAAPVPEDGTTVVYDEAKGAYVPGPVPGSGTSGASDLTVVLTNTTIPPGTVQGQLAGYHNGSASSVTVSGAALDAGEWAVWGWFSGAWQVLNRGTVGGGAGGGVDTTPPNPGTLTASAIDSTSFTLSVTGASDGGGLPATPFAFSTDNGATWSAWQAGTTHSATGRTASTAYQCKHKVRDLSGNEAQGTAITVTTTPATDTTAPTPGTLTASAIDSTSFTLTVAGASDAGAGLHPTPFAFSTDNGATWSAWTESASFVVTGRTHSTSYQCKHKVRDAAPTPNEAQGATITVTTGAPSVTPLLTDTFTAADNAAITGRTVGGYTWAADTTGMTGYGSAVGAAKIVSNKAASGTGPSAQVMDVATHKVRVTTDYALSAPAGHGLRVHIATRTPNAGAMHGFWLAVDVTGLATLIRGLGFGSAVTIGTSGQSAPTGTITLEYDGDTVRAIQNGVQFASASGLTSTPSQYNGTHVGFWFSHSPGMSLDNYKVEAFA